MFAEKETKGEAPEPKTSYQGAATPMENSKSPETGASMAEMGKLVDQLVAARLEKIMREQQMKAAMEEMTTRVK